MIKVKTEGGTKGGEEGKTNKRKRWRNEGQRGGGAGGGLTFRLLMSSEDHRSVLLLRLSPTHTMVKRTSSEK